MRTLLLIISCVLLLQGCSSVAYYWEKIQGQAEILNKQQPIQEVIDNPQTPESLRVLLVNAQQARTFASDTLLLPDNNSYRNYVDVGRDYVVWTVVATPPYSIEPKEWCFFIVGCLSYRGYFSQQAAEEFATDLKAQGMDVYVSGAKAYSTLGWFDDPLLSTMLYKSEAYRVGIIFHELAHQKTYVDNDTAFNEAFATTVELEGIKTWFKQTNEQKKLELYLISRKRDKDFKKLLTQTREALKQFYAKNKLPEELQKGKQNIFAKLQLAYKNFKQRWNNYTGYDKWFTKPVNNPRLALVATYNDWLPAFSKLLEDSKRDYRQFYKKVAALTELDKEQRNTKLEELMSRYE